MRIDSCRRSYLQWRSLQNWLMLYNSIEIEHAEGKRHCCHKEHMSHGTRKVGNLLQVPLSEPFALDLSQGPGLSQQALSQKATDGKSTGLGSRGSLRLCTCAV